MFALPVTSLQEKEPRMKPTTIVISLVLGLLTLSLLGGFGSSAASDSRGLPAAAASDESASEQATPTGQSQSDDEAGVDADLGRLAGRLTGKRICACAMSMLRVDEESSRAGHSTQALADEPSSKWSVRRRVV